MAQLNASSGSKITFDGTVYPVTNIKYSAKVDNTDITDSNTAVGFKESIDGRGEYTFTFDGYKDNSVSDIPTGTKKACILNYGAARYIGSASIQSIDVDGNVIDGVVKVSYAGKFHGAVSASL